MLKLNHIDTCLPDYFQGSPHPTIAVPVDATTTANELKQYLMTDTAWPEGLTDPEIIHSVIDCIGEEALRHNTHLFPDIYPEEEPDKWFVASMPDGKFAVVDLDSSDITSICEDLPTARCQAWIDAAAETPMVYAYFSIEVELPEGWDIKFKVPTQAEHLSNTMPCFIPMHLESGMRLGGFDTEAEAKLAIHRQPTLESPYIVDVSPQGDDIKASGKGYTIQISGPKAGIVGYRFLEMFNR